MTENTGAAKNKSKKLKGSKIYETHFKKFSGFYRRLDKGLLVVVTVCSVISVVLLYSLYKNEVGGIESGYYVTQLVSTALGIVVCLIVASIDYHTLSRLWFLYAPAALFLVLLTFTGLGLQRAGADDRAWLNLGFTTIQPPELLSSLLYLRFHFICQRTRPILTVRFIFC